MTEAMTREQIVEFANKAARSQDSRLLGCGVGDLMRFAEQAYQLGIKEGREQAAKVCDATPFSRANQVAETIRGINHTEAEGVKVWKVFSAARYDWTKDETTGFAKGKCVENFDMSHMSQGHPNMVDYSDYTELEAKLAVYESALRPFVEAYNKNMNHPTKLRREWYAKLPDDWDTDIEVKHSAARAAQKALSQANPTD